MSAPNGKQNDGPARSRYWLKHDKPARLLTSPPNMQKRIRASEYTLLQQIADLGSQSDVAVLRNKPNDLVRNRAFAEHQQKLRGQIDRLAVVRTSLHASDAVTRRKIDGVPVFATGSARIPHRAELDGLKSAFKTLDIHYEPCGKRTALNRCTLSNGHINDCREEY